MTSDDLELNLDDVLVESGFRKRQAMPRTSPRYDPGSSPSIRRDRAQESHAAMRLLADTPYLLIPMTYKKARATTTAAQRQ